MRIAVDAQLTVGTSTGIGEYAAGLIGALQRSGLDVVPLRAKELDPWRFDRRLWWDQIGLPAAARATSADLLHCASGTMPLLQPAPVVVTVHDVAWLRAQRHTRFYARAYFGTFARSQYVRAREIVVDSHFSRGELLHYLRVPHERVHVVYPGVAHDYCELEPLEPERYVLCAGTVERRKNLAVVIRALRLLPPDVRLIVAGPPTQYERECRRLAATLDVADRILWRGYVSRAAMLDLFARAGVVAVPSLYEGFGYAAAQALCAGAPVLVADSSSLPEIVGELAASLDPHDPMMWATALQEVLDSPHRARERALRLRPVAVERFSWRTAARRMAEIYRSARR
ncbi:MAG: glycosyltransferase family 1 protein [Vulcanimicrobiaceae bacterium]